MGRNGHSWRHKGKCAKLGTQEDTKRWEELGALGDKGARTGYPARHMRRWAELGTYKDTRADPQNCPCRDSDISTSAPDKSKKPPCKMGMSYCGLTLYRYTQTLIFALKSPGMQSIH